MKQEMSKEYITRILNNNNPDMQKVLMAWYKPALTEEQIAWVKRHKNWLNRSLEDIAQEDFGFKKVEDKT